MHYIPSSSSLISNVAAWKKLKFESVFLLDLFYMTDFSSIFKFELNENWFFLTLP